MIRINTNENYFNEDLNVILENNNKDLNEFILNIGTLIVKNIDIINNFPTINSNTKEIEKYQDIIHGLYQKISIIDNQNHKNIQNLINNFEKNNFVSENDNLKYKIDDLETKLANKNNNDNFIVINDKISLIENKFQIFLDRFSKGNTEKGNFGEKFIQNYIKDKFFKGYIEESIINNFSPCGNKKKDIKNFILPSLVLKDADNFINLVCDAIKSTTNKL